MANVGKIEYRVRPVTRYTVTRYHSEVDGCSGCDTKGEYESADVAFEVATALIKEEHQRLGFAPGDERIVYPQHPNEMRASAQKAVNSGSLGAIYARVQNAPLLGEGYGGLG